jgi:hypothetical protein
MQTNIAPAGDYDQAWAAGNTRTTILIWRYVPINAQQLRAMVYAAARTRRQYQNLMREGS